MGRASADGLRGLAIAAVAALLIAALVGAADGKKKRAAAASSPCSPASSTRRSTPVRSASRSRARAAESCVDGVQGSGSVGSTRRRRSGPASTPCNVPLSAAGRSAIGGCSVDRADRQVRQGQGKKKGKKSAGKSSPRHPSIATRRLCSAGSENPTARPYTARRSTPRTRTAATSWIPRSACSPGRTTTSPRRTRPPTPGAGSTSTPSSTPANIHGVHIDTDRHQPGRRLQPGQPDHAQDPAGRDAGGVRQHRLRAGQRPASLLGRRISRSVVIDAATGQRQPIFAELDPNPNHYSPGDTKDVNLIIRPTRNFTEGHRYIVALRGLRDAQNNPVDPPLPLPRLPRPADHVRPGDREPPSPHGGPDLDARSSDGIQRSNLYMTWDFTVASEHSLAGRALAIRDNALHQLGDDSPGNGTVDGSAPTFHIPNVIDRARMPALPREHTATGRRGADQRSLLPEQRQLPSRRHVQLPGQRRRDRDADRDGRRRRPDLETGDPTVHTTGVDFRCVIPQSAVAGSTVHPTAERDLRPRPARDSTPGRPT